MSRERTAASRIRLSSSETPYGPNQRTFNVLLDLFVYFSLAAFCFWWQYLFSLFIHTNYLHTQNISTFFDCFVNKHSQAIPYNAELVICSFNVRGLSNTMKRRETFRWLNMKKYAVYFLQEVHCKKNKEHIRSAERGYSAIFSSFLSASAGACVLFNNNFNLQILKSFSDPEGRFVMVDIKLENKISTLVNIYAPNEDKPTFLQNV